MNSLQELVGAPDLMSTPVSTGTTIVAVEFDGGVVVGADTRTTQGTYISNRFTNKIRDLVENVVVCCSGSAADTQAVTNIVKYHLGLLKMELGEPVPVKIAASDVSKITYQYRESLSAGMIVGGWDRKLGGQVYIVTIGGMMKRQKYALGGSGSGYIYGFMDENYSEDMDRNACIEYVLKALTQAIWRDGSSGGCARIAVITEKGVERLPIVTNDQLKTFYLPTHKE